MRRIVTNRGGYVGTPRPPDAGGRISASFCRRDRALIAASRFSAGPLLEGGSTRVVEATSIRNAAANLREAKAFCPVAMVGPPPLLDPEQNQRTRRLSEAFEAVAFTVGVPYLSVFDRLLADPVWMSDLAANDGSHPGRVGYERLASLVLMWRGWWFHEG